MIKIKLLGGAQNAVGRSSVIFERSVASISEIITFLQQHTNGSKLLNPNNILIAVNGVESSLMRGNDTIVTTGDIITIVSVVHGGTFFNKSIYQINS